MTVELVPMAAQGNGYAGGNSHAAPQEFIVEQAPSAYLRYLPAVYWQDPFVGRFLRVFEDVLSPIQRQVNRRVDQFDPSLAPLPMLQVLASWVGVDEFGELPEDRARQMVRHAITLNQWRGTRKGLRLALTLATGQRPLISEYSAGLVLGEDAVLGRNTSLQSGRPLRFHVLFECREDEVDSSLVRTIIRHYKPAAAVYSISFGS